MSILRKLRSVLVIALLALSAGAPAAAQGTGSESQAAEGGDASALPPEEAKLLADLLRDEAKRDALIAQLERAGAPEQAEAAPAAQESESSIGRQLAEATAGVAERAAAAFISVKTQVTRIPDAFGTFSGDDLTALISALQALALVLVVTVGVYLFLRFWIRRFFRAVGDRNAGAGIVRTLVLLVVTTVIDAAVVVAAWAAGYVAALLLSGEMGEIDLRQALFLNAFLIVGMVRVGIRALLAPSSNRLRLVNVPDVGARAMSRWFGAIATILGFGQLLLVPIVNEQVSPFAGRGVSTLVALIAILIGAALIFWSRRAVTDWVLGEDPAARSGLTRLFARIWHIPALLYLVGLFVVVTSRPDGVIWPVLQSSGEVFALIVAGVIISGAITRSIAKGVTLPQGMASRLPALEGRLNTFVPRALLAVRALIVLVVVAFAITVLGVYDFAGWLESEVGVRLTGMLISAAVILLLAFAIWLALASWIDFRLNPEFGSVPSSREITLLTLLKSAATILLLVVTLMFVLAEIGLDIAPLLASAGVIGLAIGFGAQKLVQDIITGVFIQFENAMNVGDVVTLGGTTGTVEKLTIRSVSLRDLHGVFHIIPFSSVDLVSNYVRGYGHFVADIGVAYRENIDECKAAMTDAFTELKASEAWGGKILDEEFQWFGVQALGDSAVLLRGRIKCVPGMQWGVGRAYNEICKRIMDERGIEIPFPHQTVYFGEAKEDAPPAARVLLEGGAGEAQTAGSPKPDPA